LTQRVNAGGYHVFKAGLDGDFATYDHKAYYTAGQRWQRLQANSAAGAPGAWRLREFYGVKRNTSDPDNEVLAPGEVLCANDQAVCGPIDQKSADTLNRTLAA